MKIELILHPVYVSGIGNNHCPVCAGIAVRNQQESVSGLRKNHCPEWSGISVRFTQEYAGVQIIGEKAWESAMPVHYKVRGVPTFMFFGPEGKIIDVKMTRPSNQETRDKFDSYSDL